jgi:hypothetical protein
MNSKPNRNRIFVFGSNLGGRHGKGAALHAAKYYGAQPGYGIGLRGNSYAIPTKDGNLKVLPLEIIKGHIRSFVMFAKANNDRMQFNVTRVGCGLSNFRDEQIAPSFSAEPLDNCWYDPIWMQYFPPETNYWEAPI